MSTPSDFDRIARAWLADGPTELADRVLDEALADIHRTRQRRPMTGGRFAVMSSPVRIGIAIAAAVVVIVGGALILRGGAQTPVAASPAAPSPSASLATSGASIAPAAGPRVTLTDRGCYGEKLDRLRAGALRIEAASETADTVQWDLLSVNAGHTWPDVAAVVVERQQRVASGGEAGDAADWMGHWAMAETSPSSRVANLDATATPGTFLVVCVSVAADASDTGVFVVGPITVAP